MPQNDLCPWCHQHPDINGVHGVACCEQAQDAEQACEALEASDAPDDRLVSAAVTYWQDIAADLASMRHRMTYQALIMGTEQMSHTTNGARRAA